MVVSFCSKKYPYKLVKEKYVFYVKKEKYKFQVDLILEDLTAVPFVNGMLFAKVRLLDGGSFSEMSSREEVKDHCVKWGTRFRFCCKMSTNVVTGVLDPCLCRISVRMEAKGGRSFLKLGFVDLNMAESAGAGVHTRRCLLEGYDTKHRQDNSILQVTLQMILLSGDPCFKVPFVKPSIVPGEQPEEQLLPERKTQDYSESSLTSSGFGSLPRKSKTDTTTTRDETEWKKEDPSVHQVECELGHSRNSSYASQQSHASGYSSLQSHSRQGSSESGHLRNLSSGFSDMGLLGMPKLAERKRLTGKKQFTEENRIDSTRVNADQLIKELFEASNFDEAEESVENRGLQLFINKDGKTSLGSQSSKSQSSRAMLEKVIIEHR
ncbi:protein FAM102B-like [Limulus polyphemus]|uniref:Protein FAM102B-like n=1 Tax=Limulus polyphemus TaxID=6850 RepID=A0ABM1S4E3_LIMPO|nr:protein FAM102B-like [Limulus polyphemus]